MAESVTIVSDPFSPSMHIRRVKFVWVSAESGTAEDTTSNYVDGVLLFAAFTPDSGDTQPSDAYDVTVKDGDGYDILCGNGADLSNAATVYKNSSDGLGAVSSSPLTLAVENAGDSNGGTVCLWFG